VKRLPLPDHKKAPLRLPHKTVTTCVAPQQATSSRRWQRLRRSVTDMPRRAQVSRAANLRYLEALASTQATEPLGVAVQRLCQPIQKDGYRFRGLNPLSGPDAALLQVLSRGEWTINGFRNADIRKHLSRLRSGSPQHARRRSAAVTRKRRLLRAHGLIRKIKGSHRYQLTRSGRKLITLLLTAARADVQQLTALAA